MAPAVYCGSLGASWARTAAGSAAKKAAPIIIWVFISCLLGETGLLQRHGIGREGSRVLAFKRGIAPVVQPGFRHMGRGTYSGDGGGRHIVNLDHPDGGICELQH